MKSSGKTLYDYAPEENQWWKTVFDPSQQNAQADNLESMVTINLIIILIFGIHLNRIWKESGNVMTIHICYLESAIEDNIHLK